MDVEVDKRHESKSATSNIGVGALDVEPVCSVLLLYVCSHEVIEKGALQPTADYSTQVGVIRFC
jgi:hypothetical protein